MASAPIVISSSPPRKDSFLEAAWSSSPNLPRLSDIFAKNESRKTHTSPSSPPASVSLAASTFATSANQSRAQPIAQGSQPRDIAANQKHVPFTASPLWDFGSEDDMAPPPSNQNAFMLEQDQRQRRAPSQRSEDMIHTKLSIHKPELPRPVVESSKQLAKQRRKKKADPLKQTVLPKGKVTKAVRAEKPALKKPEVVSHHFPPSEPRVSLQPGEPVGLELATSRRTDWTPTKDSKTIQTTTDPSDILERRVGFQKLAETFGRQEEPSVGPNGAEVEVSASNVLKKRKVVELVAPTDTRGGRKAVSPRPKAPKKKARTLTDLATSAYAVDGGDDPFAEPFVKPARASKTKARPAPKFLSYDGKDKVIARRGAGTSIKTKKKAPKPGDVALPILLSPSEAMKRAGNQDFVFGTSSQLVREKSPSILKNIQAAVQASLEDIDGEKGNGETRKSTKDKNNRLWMAGARDEEGELVEIIDLVDVTEVPHGLLKEGRQLLNQDSIGEPPSTLAELNFQDTPDDMSVASTRLLTPAATTNPASITSHVILESASASVSEAPDVPSQPHYELYTDAQLSREITSYGFKPLKRRTAMIALLDECWDSKHGIPPGARALSTTSIVPAAQKSKAKGPASGASAPVKKSRARPKETPSVEEIATTAKLTAPKRGRPKKAPVVEEIAEASEPVVPKRGRAKKAVVESTKPTAKSPKKNARPTTSKRKGKGKASAKMVVEDSDLDADLSSAGSEGFADIEPFSSPLAIDIGTTTNGSSDELSLLSPHVPTFLSMAITKAVTSAPRSKDPNDPSWHERILMYDPVILEDLAEWLNSGQLERVGWDNGDVGLTDLKTWCMGKSICHLSKITSRGQERKRLVG